MRVLGSVMLLLGVAVATHMPLTGNERVELRDNSEECENVMCEPPWCLPLRFHHFSKAPDNGYYFQPASDEKVFWMPPDPYESLFPARWAWGPYWLEIVSYPGYILEYGYAQVIHDECLSSQLVLTPTYRVIDAVCRSRPTSFIQVPDELSKLGITSSLRMQDKLQKRSSFDCLEPGSTILMLQSAT